MADDLDFDALLGLDAPPAPAPPAVDWAALAAPAAPARVVRKNVRRVGDAYNPANRRELNLDDIRSKAADPLAVERANAMDRVDIAWGVAAVLAKAGPQSIAEAAAGAAAAPRAAPLQIAVLQAQLDRYMRGQNVPVPGGDPAARYPQHDYTAAIDAADAPRTTCVLYADEDADGGLEREALGAGMRLHQRGAWQLLRAMAAAQRSDFRALVAGWQRFHTPRGGDGAPLPSPYAGWEDNMAELRAREPAVNFNGKRTPKGILMFHSTGTGKTAVSVAAMQAFWQQYDRPLLYVSTTAAVQSVIGKRAAQEAAAGAGNPCGGQAHKSEYAKLADLLFPTTLGSDDAAYDAALDVSNDAAGKCVQTYLGNPMTVSSRLKAITFKQAAEFAELTRDGGRVDQLCNKTKTEIGTRKDFPRFGAKENMRGITNAIMIIDEAHNLLAHSEWDVAEADDDDADAARRLEARRAEIAQEKAAVAARVAEGDVAARDAMGAYELRQFLKSRAADGVTLVLLTATPGSTPAEMRALCDLLRRSDDVSPAFAPLVSYYNGNDNTADFPTVRVADMAMVPMHPAQAKEVNEATTQVDALKASTIPACAAVLLPRLRGGAASTPLAGGETREEASAAMNAIIAALEGDDDRQAEARAAKAAFDRAKTRWPERYREFQVKFGDVAAAPARTGLAALAAEEEADDGPAAAAAAAAAADAMAAAAPVAAADLAAAAERAPSAEDDMGADARKYDADVRDLLAAYARGLATIRTLDPRVHERAQVTADAAVAAPSPCDVPAGLTPEARVDLMMQRAPKLARVAADMVGSDRAPATKVFAYTQFGEAAHALELMLVRKGWKLVTAAQLLELNAFLMRDVPSIVNAAAVQELEDSILDGAASYVRVRAAFENLRRLTYTTAEDGDGVEAGVLNQIMAVPERLRPSSVESLRAQLTDAAGGLLARAARVHDDCREAPAVAAERCVSDLGRIASELLGVYTSATNMLAVLRTAADNDLRAEVNRRLGDAPGAHSGKRFIMLPAPAEAVKVFNHFLNRDGDIIMGIVATGSTLEGINLKTARRILAIEPQESAAKVRQLMGRARRYCSHAELPAGSRRVEFVRYASVHSDEDIEAGAAMKEDFRVLDEDLRRRRDTLVRRLEEGWRAPMRERVAAVETAEAARYQSMGALRAAYDAVVAVGGEFREAKAAGGMLHARTALLRGRLAAARLQYKAAARSAQVAVQAAVNERRAEVELRERLLGDGDAGLREQMAALERGQEQMDATARTFYSMFGVPITQELDVADIESQVYELRQEEEAALNTAYDILHRASADYTVLRNLHERMRR